MRPHKSTHRDVVTSNSAVPGLELSGIRGRERCRLSHATLNKRFYSNRCSPTLNTVSEIVQSWVDRIATGVPGGLPALLPPGERLVVAVSGGLDSVVLLDLLTRLQARYGWALLVAHCHHGLRGPDADADAAWVAELAQRARLPFELGKERFHQLSLDTGKESVEMAARRIRHVFLTKTARTWGAQRVVLAHHADDQIELVFLRLLRGAGGQGLGGMRPIAPAPMDPTLSMVRPLLNFSRQELRAYAERYDLSFREDTSNADQAIPRNRWRQDILPRLEESFGSGWKQAVLRTAELVRDEADAVQALAHAWKTAAADRLPWAQLPCAVQRRVLYNAALALGRNVDFETIEWLRQNPGRVRQIRPNLQWVQGAGHIVQSVGPDSDLPEYRPDRWIVDPTKFPSCLDLDLGRLQWSVEPATDDAIQQAHRAWTTHREARFDADSLKSPLTLRFWQPGDRFHPLGLPQPVKLQDWFTNHKVPAAERRTRLILESGDGDVVWVEGFPPGNPWRLTQRTRTELRLRFFPHRPEVAS